MTKAPERIWVWPDYNDHCIPFKQDWTHGFWDETEDPLGTEYVRADRIKAQAAEIERLRGDLAKAMEALQSVIEACDQGRMIPRSGVGGMTIEANIKGSIYVGVPAWPIEEARTTLAELKGRDDE